MTGSILLPATVLVLWTLVMLFWMAGVRVPAAQRIGVDIAKSTGGRASDIEPKLPPEVTWKSHNHTHLHEQPTLFYATVLILAVQGANTELNVGLAWAYVALRIAHSLWQALVNKVNVRFALFLASTLCLVVLAVNALRATL